MAAVSSTFYVLEVYSTCISHADHHTEHARELERHYNNKFIKAGLPLEPEFEENLAFFKEM